MKIRASSAVIFLAAGTIGAPLCAQGAGVTMAVGGAEMRLQNTTSVGTGVLTGTGTAVDGSLFLGRVALEGTYLESTLDPTGGALGSEELVDGAVFLRARPTAFLQLKTGVHARSYATTGGTERWVFWEARARGEAPLGESGVRAYMEVWRTITSQASAPAPLDHAQGGEGGLEAMVLHNRFGLRVSYTIDDARSVGGQSRQTLESFVFAVDTHVP